MQKKIILAVQLASIFTALWLAFSLHQSTFNSFLLLGSGGLTGFFFWHLIKISTKRPKTNYERKNYQPHAIVKLGALTHICLFISLAGILNTNFLISEESREQAVIVKKHKGGVKAPGKFLKIKTRLNKTLLLKVSNGFWEDSSAGQTITISIKTGLLGFRVVTTYMQKNKKI